ncbi:hypothetical protein ACFL2P_00640 [Candidatus Moduliflexota bacterium]
MTSKELENLAKTGKLKVEPGDRQEFDGLLRSAHARLADAKIESLSIESRFDLAYNASHALALAALRWHGYRSENRYLVFQALQHTAGLGPEVWRVLSLCHDRRNRAEYQGHVDIDEQLVADLVSAAEILLKKVSALGPVP